MKPLPLMVFTQSQRRALRWLYDHSGDGLFDKNGVALCGGKSAPYMRATWNALRDLKLVEFYNPLGKGRGRLRITEAGIPYAKEIAPEVT